MQTPPDRDWYADFLRVGSIGLVVLGHWLAAVVLVRNGELVTGRLHALVPWTQWLTWVFQVGVLHPHDRRHVNEVNMKRLTLTIGIGLIVCGIPSAQGQAPTATTGTRPAPTASANLVDAQGRSVGQAYLQQAPHGILLKLDLKNTTPGIHGLHIHDVGRCERPSFESAGGHFNPSNRQHGLLNPRGPHAGDLPNIEVPSTTQLSVEYFLADVTIEPGPRSLTDNNSSSIVIHAGKDDYATDPAGESGDRLACGPIVRSETR